MQSNLTSEQQKETTPGKIKDRINGNSSIRLAFEIMQENRSWSNNTLSSYSNNISSLEAFMLKNQIEPIIENIDFEMVQQWVKYLREEKKEKSKTIKQRIACMSSFLHSLNLWVYSERTPF
ncbi:site-specific integrase [Bacillus sp. MRMR6]|uniref:site-specific integrase n=1 Tax=Bacillus sp. MRMR6 TaxID=1928617 RepID=UPI000951F3DB|nr:site-specific integrase [Bacillus sp. MRMR6]OLS38584.1 hypothetical protein BTR25_14295 [Bacillus sp. MRMR6]